MQKRYFARGWVALFLALVCTLGLSTVLWAADDPPTVEPGLVVAAVDHNGPAAAAGVKRGDIVLAVDGAPVNRLDELLAALAQVPAGASVTLQIQHGDAVQEVVVKTALRDQRAYLGILPYTVPMSDVTTSSLAVPTDPTTLPVPAAPAPLAEPDMAVPAAPGRPMLVIVDVLKGSAAAAAGLQPQDVITAVNGEAVGNPAVLHKLVTSVRPGEPLTLTITRGAAAPQDVVVVVGQGPAGQALLGVKVGVAVTTTLEGHNDLAFAMPTSPVLPPVDQKFYHFEGEMPLGGWTLPLPGCMISGGLLQEDVAQHFMQLPPDTMLIAPAPPAGWVAQPALLVEQNSVIVVQGQAVQEQPQLPGTVQQGMVEVAPAQAVDVTVQAVVPDVQGYEITLDDQAVPTQPAASVEPMAGDYY